MIRFVALVYNLGDEESRAQVLGLETRLQRSTAFRWSAVMMEKGCMVWSTGSDSAAGAKTLVGGRGVILGNVFAESAEEPSALSESEALSGEILSSAGRALAERYWGRYVAILHCRDSHRTWVIRDPSGGLPCFYKVVGRLTVLFSDLEVCLKAEIFTAPIDWDFIAGHVREPAAGNGETALVGVEELFQGRGIEISTARGIRGFPVWQPASFMDGSFESEEAAQAELKRAVDYCVGAWASCYPSALLELSGGLDSAIVLSGVSALGGTAKLTCVNSFQRDSRLGDEREYARAAAKAADVEYLEIEDRVDVPLEELLRLKCTPAPGEYFGVIQRSPPLREIARSRGATAIFSGFGGDQLFFAGPMILTAVDRLFYGGTTREFLMLVLELSRSSGRLFWSVLREVMRAPKANKSPVRSGSACNALIGSELKGRPPGTVKVHPWLEGAEGLPAGKRQHINALAVAPLAYNLLEDSDGPDSVAPLLSQPLMQFCLKKRTYELSGRGTSRSLARDAFRSTIPQCIVSRRVKGAVDYLFPLVLERNRSFVRDMLLGGVLATQPGLLDLGRLDQILNGSLSGIGPLAGEILCSHLSTEAWIRSILRAH